MAYEFFVQHGDHRIRFKRGKEKHPWSYGKGQTPASDTAQRQDAATTRYKAAFASCVK